MTNRSEANKLASKITGETVNASTTKGAIEAISGKKAARQILTTELFSVQTETLNGLNITLIFMKTKI